MLILDRIEMLRATGEGGSVGPQVRLLKSVFGGELAGSIGIDLTVKKSTLGPGGVVDQVADHKKHIAISVQIRFLEKVWLIIPKEDILEWGVLTRGSIPFEKGPNHISAIIGLLAFGPIGLLTGAAMDKSATKQKDNTPVIGIAFRTEESECAIFLEFTFNKGFKKVYELLKECLQDKLKE